MHLVKVFFLFYFLFLRCCVLYVCTVSSFSVYVVRVFGYLHPSVLVLHQLLLCSSTPIRPAHNTNTADTVSLSLFVHFAAILAGSIFFLTEYTMIEHNNEGLLAPSIDLTSHIFVLGTHQLA